MLSIFVVSISRVKTLRPRGFEGHVSPATIALRGAITYEDSSNEVIVSSVV